MYSVIQKHDVDDGVRTVLLLQSGIVEFSGISRVSIGLGLGLVLGLRTKLVR